MFDYRRVYILSIYTRGRTFLFNIFIILVSDNYVKQKLLLFRLITLFLITNITTL